MLREHRLVTLAIGALIRPVDVRRQGNMTRVLQEIHDGRRESQQEELITALHDCCLAAVVERDPAAGLRRVTCAQLYQGDPVVENALDQHLELTAAFLATEDARGDHARCR